MFCERSRHRDFIVFFSSSKDSVSILAGTYSADEKDAH